MAKNKIFTSEELMNVLSDMRNQYRKEFKDIPADDEVARIILKAKIVTIGQVLDELGLETNAKE